MKKLIKILLAPFNFIKKVIANLFKKKPTIIDYDNFLNNYKKAIATKSNIKATYSHDNYIIELSHQEKEKKPQTSQNEPKTTKKEKAK